MALQVWLPLNGNLDNQGLSNVTVSNSGAIVDGAGKIGSCYRFNGSSSYMTFSTPISLDGDHSICCWLDLTNVSAVQYFISFATVNNPVGGIRYSGGDNSFLYYAGGVTKTWTYTKVNRFVHVAFVCGANSISLYVDGQSIGSSQSLTTRSDCTGIGRRSDGYYYNGKINDFRIYDHCLSPKEVKEIAQGLVLHYKLDDPYVEGTTNLGGTSMAYSNIADGYSRNLIGWGGDAGTVTFYHSGGYNNGPYKVYHKTATGTGGVYTKTANDITIEAGKTYTMSIYVKSDRDYTDSTYSFNINGVTASDNNHYITASSSVHFTNEWTRVVKTFTATENDAGTYGEMSIIYNDAVEDYYVYFSCFQIEEKDHATPYVNGTREVSPIYDCSGYGRNGSINGTLTTTDNSPRYNNASVLTYGTNSYIEGYFPANGTDVTFCLWAYFPGSSILGGHLLDCRENDNGYQPMYIYPNGTGIQIGNSQNGFPVIQYNFTTNTWYHIVVASNNENSHLYINGQYITSTATGYGYDYSMNLPLTIGCRHSHTTSFIDCKVSDFRIYNTCLSLEDILDIYQTSALIQDNYNIEAFEFDEINEGSKELNPWPLTIRQGYTSSNFEYLSDGSVRISGYTWLRSTENYIPVDTSGKTYYYDIEYSNVEGNHIFIGFEAFDENKNAGQNEDCRYAIGNFTGATVHKRETGTITIRTTTGNPTAYTRLRVLNDWYEPRDPSHVLTIHHISLKEVVTLTDSDINKNGVINGDTFIEAQGASISKTGNIIANQFNEI